MHTLSSVCMNHCVCSNIPLTAKRKQASLSAKGLFQIKLNHWDAFFCDWDSWLVHYSRDTFSRVLFSPYKCYWYMENGDLQWPCDVRSSVAQFLSWSLQRCSSCTLCVMLFWHYCGRSCFGEMTQLSSKCGEVCSQFPVDSAGSVSGSSSVWGCAHTSSSSCKTEQVEERMGSCWRCVGEQALGGLGWSGSVCLLFPVEKKKTKTNKLEKSRAIIVEIVPS